MADLQILRWIRDSTETGAVDLARSLIFAEAGARGAPLGSHYMTGQTKAGDEGVDGRTSFPDGDFLLPTGPQVWQVKSGKSTPSVTSEFKAGHVGLLNAIKDGHDYVLFWTKDPEDPVLTNVRTAFEQAVRDVRADAAVTFLFADQIERLCLAHMGVLLKHSILPLSGLVSLDVWGAQDDYRNIAYQPDQRRQEAIDLLRAHAASVAPEPAAIHLVGDTGLGKSRLVHEALRLEEISGRVLVAPDAAYLDRGLLSVIAQEPERRAIVVVDDCTADDRKALSSYVDMARGRLRLITLGSRLTRERQAPDARYIEVMPLEVDACQQIAASQGLPDADARMVAEYTEGYPGLALNLARALRFGDANQSLINRVRGHDELGGVLASLLPAESVLPLGMLSLFERVGFDGDVSTELAIVCEILGVDESLVRGTADTESLRFVSNAGRFKRVTPKLFALWLASEFMRARGDALASALRDLPPTLRERILDQMGAFAGDDVVSAALAALLDADPFEEGALAGVDEGAARLIHVAAVASPAAAIRAIERLMSGASLEVLRNFVDGRRDLVWALELLIWFPEHFEIAADSLLRLAVAENEHWSNNATGVLQGMFRVFLGGTAASYETRIGWASRVLAEGEPAARSVVVDCLALAFDSHESRTSPNFGGLAAPIEWRPASLEEERAARAGAWALLIQTALDHPENCDQVAAVVAKGARTAIRRGLAMAVARDISRPEWSALARSRIGRSLSSALEHDNLAADAGRELRAARTVLFGATVQDQVRYVLSSSPWDLASSREEMTSGIPSSVSDLATAMAGLGVSEAVSLASDVDSPNGQTMFLLWRLIGERVASAPEVDLALRAISDASVSSEASLGLFRGLCEGQPKAWAVDELARWLNVEHLCPLVIRAAHSLPATHDLAQLCIRSVSEGGADREELGILLFGGWASGLPDRDLTEVLVHLLQQGSAQSVESALGILSQRLESDRPRGEQITGLGVSLISISRTLDDRAAPMLSHYRSLAISKLDVPLNTRLSLVVDNLANLSSFPDEGALETVAQLAEEAPRETVAALLPVLMPQANASIAEKWISSARILTVLQRGSSGPAVRETVLQECEPADWTYLLDHISFDDSEPDPLFREMVGQSAGSPELLSHAASRFMYPDSGWVGSQSNYVRGRIEVAEAWRSGTGDDLMAGWLTSLVEALRAELARVELVEIERGY